MNENREINFNGDSKPSRLSYIACSGYDNSSGTAAFEIKTKTYCTPAVNPRFLLDMEARSSIPLWGITRTNSLVLMCESEMKRNEVKQLISQWKLSGKMHIPPRYNLTAECLMIFNSFPMYLAGLKIFNEYLSVLDPLFGFKNLKILNMKTCLTERQEFDKKTGHTVLERQIIIARQLDCGPAMLYISSFLKDENMKEGVRYQCKYSQREFENEEQKQTAQAKPFDFSHDSLIVQKNWTPMIGQTNESSEADLNRWVNTVVGQDVLYLRRLDSRDRLEVLAIKNRKSEKKLPTNARRIFDLETYTSDQESTFVDNSTLEGSIRRSELASCSTVRNVSKVSRKAQRSENRLIKKNRDLDPVILTPLNFRNVGRLNDSNNLKTSYAIKNSSADSGSSGSGSRPITPAVTFNKSFFGETSSDLFNWRHKKALGTITESAHQDGNKSPSGLSLLELDTSWSYEDPMSQDGAVPAESTPINEVQREI